MLETIEVLPSPTAYPRQERKKSHWLSQLPLSVPSSSLSMSAFDSASVMVLESLLPSPFPIFASLCLPSVVNSTVKRVSQQVGSQSETTGPLGTLKSVAHTQLSPRHRNVPSPSRYFSGAISLAHVAVALCLRARVVRTAISHLLGHAPFPRIVCFGVARTLTCAALCVSARARPAHGRVVALSSPAPSPSLL